MSNSIVLAYCFDYCPISPLISFGVTFGNTPLGPKRVASVDMENRWYGKKGYCNGGLF